ncbi:hypothetical protein FRX31_029731 [Thalictrum thalictroides]|uniref:Uncharacterized protein n=1 Tax=Thalictrum thalictroides TaxID=46969 RepID=A0A7J6V8H0_THATH|nr:hypothetical protein FRX31_029731 [Thalictrum thalictroides]
MACRVLLKQKNCTRGCHWNDFLFIKELIKTLVLVPASIKNISQMGQNLINLSKVDPLWCPRYSTDHP